MTYAQPLPPARAPPTPLTQVPRPANSGWNELSWRPDHPDLHAASRPSQATEDQRQIGGSRSATAVAPGDQVRNGPDPGSPARRAARLPRPGERPVPGCRGDMG